MYLNTSTFLDSTSRQSVEAEATPSTRNALLQIAFVILTYLLARLPQLIDCARYLFSVPAEWPLRFYANLDIYMLQHPWVPYLILSVSIVAFFGPKSFALPIVAVQNLIIHLVFLSLFLLHGLASASVSSISEYYSSNNAAELPVFPVFLKNVIIGLFELLEWLSFLYNRQTASHMPVLVFRVCWAGVGLYMLWRLWSLGWVVNSFAQS